MNTQATPPPTRPLRLVRTGAHWTPDFQDGFVMHESGLVLSMVPLPVPDSLRTAVQAMQTLDMVWLPGGYPVWAVMADPAALDDTLRAFRVHDERAAQLLVGLLAREGGNAWLEAVLADAAEDGRAQPAADASA